VAPRLRNQFGMLLGDRQMSRQGKPAQR
jgi:hypothetical protein